MSVLVVGLSHKSAPVSVLERAAVSGDTLGKLLHDVARLPDIAETFVVSTCNRVEVYAEVDRFHAGVAGVCELLSRHSGIPAHELTTACTCTTKTARSSTCSRSPAASSRWWWARTRSSARSGRRSSWPTTKGRSAGRCATWDGSRCAQASGPEPRPASTGSASGGRAWASSALSVPATCRPPVLVVGAGAMSGLAVATAARAGAA